MHILFSVFVSEFWFRELTLRLKAINEHIYVFINKNHIYFFIIYCLTF